MLKTDNSGCCTACGYGFEINRIVRCQVCGVKVRYLKCANPEKSHHVAFELGYPEVQKRHSHVEWQLKGSFGKPLMDSVKASNVRNAEEALDFIASVASDMRSFLESYNDSNGKTILDWVYMENNDQMVQLFERYL